MPLRNLLTIVIALLVSLTCYNKSARSRYASLFAEAMHLVENRALYEVPRKQLFESAMNGMMSTLDEHSMYVANDLFRALDEDMNQQFGGVGMYVDNEPDTNQLIVLAPIPNTPAFRAGVQVGDRIIQIAGQSTAAMSREEAIKLMRGPQGTSVEIVFERGDEALPKSLVREAIPIPSVHGDWRNPDGTWQFVLQDMPNVGYIRLLQFGKLSAEEMQEAISQLDGKVDGLILDLRNNTGGLLSAATAISDIFLDRGQTIVRTRGRGRTLLEELNAQTPPMLDPRIPLVVLVNRHTASASEIVSGCLQDHGRAVVIGEQTWGKGTVQDLIPMQRNESALKLTVASFWRPSERNIDRADPEAKRTEVWGIQPDPGFEIELSEAEVFNNIRSRNARELEGLRPSDVSSEWEVPEEPATEPGAASEDPASDSAPAIDESEDRVLDRAREYFRTLFSKAVAA